MKKFMTRMLSCILTLAMLISFAPLASAADKPVKQTFTSRLNFDIADSETVTAIVVFEGESGTEMVKKGLVKDILTARKKVANRQATVKKAIVNNGATLLYTYDTLLNGVSIKTTYGGLKEIEKMDGVSKVYLANNYAMPTVEVVPKAHIAAELMYTSKNPIGGKGTVIAIIDSSFSVTHEAFTYTNGLEETLTKEAVEAKLGSLNGKGVYATKKFPFVYDYHDGDTDVFSTFDHGTAVAGIAAGNNGDDYYGTAPNAQLLGMKVFPDDGSGTNSGIYFAALEDAYLLGADVINMSLGAQNGFSYDYELEDEVFGNIYETLKKEGVFVICAAGNEFSNAYSNLTPCTPFFGFEGVTVDYNDYGVVGTPSTYIDNVSVASAENTSYIADAISVDGVPFEFVDSSEEAKDNFFAKFYGQTLDFVVIPGVGEAADFNGIDVTGKVAVVQRGEIDFSKKLENAANAGAIAMICYNNDVGTIAMQISTFHIPAISVTEATGELLKASTTKKIKVETKKVVFNNENAYLMSDFSSWGCTPDLKLKPQITGIGGMVTCADCTTVDGYLSMSGTSMAAPTVAGLVATFLSTIGSTMGKDEYYVDTVMNAIYSYAYVASDAEGYVYSPRKQGAGIANLEFFYNDFCAYITNAIANLGDDPEKTGVFTYTATVEAIPDTTITLSNYMVITDYAVDLTDDGFGIYTQLASDYIPGVTITTDKESYTVDNSGKVDINITITLDDSAKEYLSIFPNGAFVEGYVYFDVNGSLSELHSTFMGFYGDWTQAPALETYDWSDVLDILYFLETTVADEETGETYAALGYTPYDMVDMNVGFNEAYTAYWEYIEDYDMYTPTPFYYLGGNPYLSAPYNPNAVAFSTPLTDGDYANSEMFLIYPSLLRNVRHIIMTVSNAETGEVYMVDDTEYALKNYYDYEVGSYYQYSLFYWDGTYLNEDGEYEYVESGTVVDVVFQTQLDYEGAELKTEREYQILVDYEAPTATAAWDADSKTVNLSAYDNNYMTSYYIYYFDAEAEEYIGLELGAMDTTAPYELWTGAIDLSANDLEGITEIYIDVEDYATNGVTLTLSLTEDNASRLKGDVNNDGKISPLDASLALQYNAQLIDLNDISAIAADVNNDGKVSPLDASLILQQNAQLLDYDFGYVTLD